MNYDSRNAGEGEIRHTLEWNQSRLYRGSMDWQEDGRACFTCPEEGLDYLLYSRAEDRSVRLEDFAYLCLKPEVCEEHSMCFQLSFYENPVEEGHELPAQEPQMRIIFGLLPQVETMVPFDFRILDSQVIFPERTPGRLKMSIFGKPVRLCDIGQIRLQTAPGFEAFHFAADECFFTDTFPDCSLQKKQLIGAVDAEGLGGKAVRPGGMHKAASGIAGGGGNQRGSFSVPGLGRIRRLEGKDLPKDGMVPYGKGKRQILAGRSARKCFPLFRAGLY